MEIELLELDKATLATVKAVNTPISSVQDAVDILGNASYMGAVGVIMREEHFHPNFFDLKTRIAGEVLQKYANYHMKLAIIGNFEKYESKALQSFIIECNRGNHIFFVSDKEAAVSRLIENLH